MLYDELIEETERTEAQHDTWKIENDQQAEWWIKRHQFELRDLQRNLSLVKEEMRILEQKELEIMDKQKQIESSMQAKLIEYFESIPDDVKKSTKTQTKYTLPSINIIRKRQNPEYVQNEEFISYLKESYPEYIEVVEKAKWGEFKKRTDVINGQLIDTETGEIVQGVEVVERPDKYEFK